MALEGIVSLSFGVLAFAWPFVPPGILHALAWWGILTWTLEIIASTRVPRVQASHWVLGLGGVSSIFLGCLLFAIPQGDHRSGMWIIAGYAFAFGALLCVAGARLRRVRVPGP